MTYMAHFIAAAAYLGAAAIGWSALERERRKRAAWMLAFGAFVHAVALYGLHVEDPPVSLESVPAAFSLIGWLVALGFLLALSRASVSGATAWAGVLAGVGTLLGTIGLWLTAPPVSHDADSAAWSHAHVLFSTAGFALLALASVAGLAYLAKERDLKHKRGLRVALPSLESLDRLEHVTLNLGFTLLTLAVISGFFWGWRRGLDLWTTHTYFLLGAWVIYILPVRLRVVQRQKGPRPARGVVVGFAVLAFAYIGIRLIGAAA